MNLKQRSIYMALIWLLALAFLALFNPGDLPVVVLIVPFILLFMALYSLWGLCQALRLKYFGQGRFSRGLKMVVCVSAILLLVLQSLGQLTLRDVVTVAAIMLIGYLYLRRTSIKLPSP